MAYINNSGVYSRVLRITGYNTNGNYNVGNLVSYMYILHLSNISGISVFLKEIYNHSPSSGKIETQYTSNNVNLVSIIAGNGYENVSIFVESLVP